MLSCPTCQSLATEFPRDRFGDVVSHGGGELAPTNSDPASAADVPASTFLASQRLWYRAPEPADAPLIASWRNAPRVRRTTSPRFPSAEAAARKWIEDKNPSERGKANDHATFMFGLKGTDEPIGYTGLFGIDWINRHAEFGIAIGPAHWSQGYGREAARQMLAYGFDELNLHRVELHVLGSNLRGIKAYQAAGFSLECTKRKGVFVDGQFEDLLLMAALHEEWRAQ